MGECCRLEYVLLIVRKFYLSIFSIYLFLTLSLSDTHSLSPTHSLSRINATLTHSLSLSHTHTHTQQKYGDILCPNSRYLKSNWRRLCLRQDTEEHYQADRHSYDQQRWVTSCLRLTHHGTWDLTWLEFTWPDLTWLDLT